jgi:hypothetical protein
MEYWIGFLGNTLEGFLGGGILYGIYWIGSFGNTLEGFLGWDPIWNILDWIFW